MAQSYTTDAGTLIIPGAYPTIKVQNGASGLATTGVIFLIGEADAGPDFTLEAEVGDNAFGPDQNSDVIAKYVSGPLVDAFKVASAPANDPDIQGSPNRFILVKTNPSIKSSSALPKIGGGTYGTLYDKSYGNLGNLIYYTIAAATSEVKPTTGAFTFIPPVGAANISLRANGGAATAVTITANMTPAAFVSAVNGGAFSATGGADRAILAVAGTIAVAATGGNNITLTRSVAWEVTPTVGDTLTIPSTSVVAGGASQNVGAYVITAATSTVITATKLSDANNGSAVIGTITAPLTVSAQAVAAVTDAKAWAPVVITLSSSTVVDGLGKSLEINELTSAADLLSRTAFVLGTITPVTWVSKLSTQALLTSASEYSVALNLNRQFDNVTEALTAGGQVAIKIGYTGTTCAAVVTATTLTLTTVGGAGLTLAVSLKNYPTLADLATYINAQTGFNAAVGTTSLGQMSPLALDEGTFAAATTFGNATLRLKVDAVKFASVISANSVLAQLGNPPTVATAGLPDVQATSTYFSGGAKGATSNAIFDAAIDTLENVKGNFVVPLFSRDASLDVADGLTDSASSYTAANIQAYVKTHCLKVSTLKRRKNRQGVVASRGTFAAAKIVAETLASFRIAATFQDVKVIGANGIVQAQPHMLAALAAGMQAAGFYRAIVNKGINCSGVLQAAADFKDNNDSNVEDALNAGLLVAKKNDFGGISWVSDQTTYSKDNNFVYNSFQAVYVADTIALTSAQRMEQAFVGQIVSDVSAALALSALEGIMGDFLRLKLISVSDDAPKGFKNASVKISGTTMLVKAEVKLAGAIYFVPISFLVSQVTQAAG